MKNEIYVEDNLKILRQFEGGSVDLICTDPPFNSGRNYPERSNNPSFTDIWKWTKELQHEYLQIQMKAQSDKQYNKLYRILCGYDLILNPIDKKDKGPLFSYLTFMGMRILEMQRVLKKQGTIYLQCDASASHYLKVLMDSLFGRNNFRNQIVWRRSKTNKTTTKNISNSYDVILRYSNSSTFIFNQEVLRKPYTETNLKEYRNVEEGTNRLYKSCPLNKHDARYEYEFRGFMRKWIYSSDKIKEFEEKGLIHQPDPRKVPRYKKYLDEAKGILMDTIWDDISHIRQSKEFVNYPTQKPLALYERLILLSSDSGDVVLDPFCGSGTTLLAANMNGRFYTGIDINFEAAKLAKRRLNISIFTQ